VAGELEAPISSLGGAMDDKVEAYVRLYERQMTHYEKTQDVEWKINIGIWTLLGAAIFWAAQNKAASKPIPVEHCLIVAVAITLVIVHALWLRRVHASEEFDKRLWSRYRREARMVLLEASPLPSDEEHSERDELDKWTWIALEAGITIAMASVLLWFLW
jgi:hypothetical protein